MQTLREIVAAHAGRHPATVAVVLLLLPYLNRVAKRFEALVRRVEAGGALVRPRAAALAPRVPRFGPPCVRRPGLPTGYAWLIRLVPYHAACVGGQVRHLLAKPEMAALFVAAPQMARIFRPLCRMLAVAPGPDLPPGLFKKRVRRRSAAVPVVDTGAATLPLECLLTAPDGGGETLNPTLSPKREGEAGLPVANWSTSPGRRAGPRLPIVRAAPA